jgi:hypothetical protein
VPAAAATNAAVNDGTGHEEASVGPETHPLDAPELVVPVPRAGEEALHHRWVHQATGMVAVQAQVSPAEAMSRLRAAAGALGRSLDDLAAAVLAGHVRLDDRDLD